MKSYNDYNILKYLESVMEMKLMMLDGILSKYSKCKKYNLSPDVIEYLQYVSDEPFYISPSFADVKTDNRVSTLNPKIILFSAPGATGKSSLAKHISYKYNALYWNLAKLKLGANSFAGSILTAVGPSEYSNFIADLNKSNVVLVIDAFDEAEIISGRKMVSSFIADISNSLTEYNCPNVIFLARTETAQYIASFCAENNISLAHYEIGFFLEDQAKDFIRKSLEKQNKKLTPADFDCIQSYYTIVKKNITDQECSSFLGYAPVLEAISTHINSSSNKQSLINDLNNQTDCASIVMNIMSDLLIREQTKVVEAFKEKCKELHPEFNAWDNLYSNEEQLVRIVNFILFKDTKYSNYDNEILPPQLIDDYQDLLKTFLPQHPFIRNNFQNEFLDNNNFDFTGPAFRDYTLAKIILSETYSDFAQVYFEETQSNFYFPSQIFFDCYIKLTEKITHSNHLLYVYDSYRAKATALERPYMQCSSITGDNENYLDGVVVFGMIPGKHCASREETVLNLIVDKNELFFEQLSNISIDAPGLVLKIGNKGIDSRISNSTIICKQILWNTDNLVIESYPPEGCLIATREPAVGDVPIIDIAHAENLRVSLPNIKDYYRLIQYNYDFEDTSNIDITKFTYAMRCILIEFRTHKKDTLAKDSERIDNVTVGNNILKRQVLDFMKSKEIIYNSAHLYKVNTTRMQEFGISYSALSRMDLKQMGFAFTDFCKWKL